MVCWGHNIVSSNTLISCCNKTMIYWYWESHSLPRNHFPQHYTTALDNIRKIRPYLNQCALELLVQAVAISYLDLLSGFPLCTVKPLQMVLNAAVNLVFNQPERPDATPLLIVFHWLPMAAQNQTKELILLELHSSTWTQSYSFSTTVFSKERCLVLLGVVLHTRQSQSTLFSFLV